MQTVRRAHAALQHLGFEVRSPLRRLEELDAPPSSGFQPVLPRPAMLSKLPTVPNGDQRWCLGQDWYTQDDDNAGWF